MDTTIIVAIIGGIAAIVAAIIPIIINKKKSQEKNQERTKYQLVYHINSKENIKSWTTYIKDKGSVNRLNENLGFRLATSDKSFIGINKSLNFLKGKIEFEYRVINSNQTQDNLIVYVIPMQESSYHKYGKIEVGTHQQDHLENQFSPFRQKVLLLGNNNLEWIHQLIEFDFTNTPNAFYVIFAPRINEGCPRPGNGEFMIRNIKFYKSI